MIVFPAQELLLCEKEELWENLTGEFCLEFEDGILQTNDRETKFTIGLWDFIRKWPIPLLQRHHLSYVLQKRMLHKNMHMELLNTILWDIYDKYKKNGRFVDHDLVEALTEELYKRGSGQYNDLVTHLPSHATTVSILDVVDLFDVPEIDAVLASVTDDPMTIIGATQQITKILKSSKTPEITNNRLVRMARAGVIKLNQLVQAIAPTGFVEDIAGDTMPVPLKSNYTDGHRSLHDNMVEAQKAGQAIEATKSELEDAVYQSRRQEILNEILIDVQDGDCGTTRGLYMKILDKGENGCQDSDLFLMAGKHYYDPEHPNELRTLKEEDTHLLGKILKFRTITHCAHPNPNGVCETCLGQISETIPRRTNLGQIMTTNLYAYIIQRQLSKKHYLASSVVQRLQLSANDQKFLRVSEDGLGYLLSPDIANYKVKLIIGPEDGKNLTDVMDLTDVTKIGVARITEIGSVSIVTDNGMYEDRRPFILGTGKRMASFTHEMLMHVKNSYWELEERTNNFIIDMDGWDFSKPFAEVPMRNDSLIDFSVSFKKHIESDVKQIERRDTMIDPDEFLIDTHRLINSELNINFAQVEVAVYGAMIRSAAENDYSLPKPWSKSGIGVMGVTMAMRSLSATMAFEKHAIIFSSVKSFIIGNRQNHPMDAILMPRETLPTV